MQVAAEWRDVVATEGPVLASRASSVIGRRFRKRVLRRDKRDAIMGAIPADLPRTRVGDDEFVWPAGVDPATYRGVRSSVRAHRKIHEIAPEEIANALRLTLSQARPGCTETELVRGVTELFGYGRMGRLIKEGITTVLDRLIRNGEFRREGQRIIWGVTATGDGAIDATGATQRAGSRPRSAAAVRASRPNWRLFGQ
ncbi:hypothetical protein [Mobilicoccus massiliensis]|uniref:hypothetical protein n=1 Tax=Mobilicoccus massiliensis TaxID=1522310 RepID=UPI00058ABE97|nr:hypothetical protein [Mobilicoccus massiliensis]